MLKPLSTIMIGLSASSVLGVGILAVAPTASAFTFNNGGITIDTNDIGASFKVSFDGNVDTQNVSGLSSEAVFKFLGFTSTANKTEATFEVTLDNTSSGGIVSRTSALGFDVDLPLLGVGADSGNVSSKTRTSGIFTNDWAGSFPNQFGAVNVCFTEGNNCKGGQNGGVKTSDAPGKFSPVLAFDGNVSRFTLSNFGVRYQSIDGNGFKGASGTGRGTPVKPPAPEPKPVPEAGTLTAVLAAGLGLLGTRKKAISAS